MLHCDQLTIRQGRRTLLQPLTWQVRAGECWWIAGRNGCGKSTLLTTLAALRRADGGHIRLCDQPLPQLTPRQRAQRLAMLPQASHDAFDYAVQDAVAAARFAWPDAGDNPQRVAAALDAFDLGRLAARPLQALSGGERQRVALASVMAQDAPLILLDEPSNSLDLAHQATLQQQIGRWCAQGKAVLLVSHDLQLAPACASHALLLDEYGAHRQYPLVELNAEHLAAVLGYPLTRLHHAGHPCFLPGHPS
ncbi:ABC transporter ATP-binding protein [Vogesella indigofera]|uniref:ABC transporter ATP-binding protein n=1 Tax=Vogesella indigofera TaxID=45465 RepID=UPI00234EE593|nr:ABC transporter ATP-binding protein [Vogesella indigofera]MDC7698208.1 ABC transporter ATP-binding protein [Vogesella indigofera]